MLRCHLKIGGHRGRTKQTGKNLSHHNELLLTWDSSQEEDLPGYLVSLVKLSIDVGRRKKMETCVLCFISSERFASAGMAMTVNTQHIPYYSWKDAVGGRVGVTPNSLLSSIRHQSWHWHWQLERAAKWRTTNGIAHHCRALSSYFRDASADEAWHLTAIDITRGHSRDRSLMHPCYVLIHAEDYTGLSISVLMAWWSSCWGTGTCPSRW